ncbi:hypothetical protein [Deinococcus sp.]|uniref:hypothetical protein n=1 Tax=Deinococcus sp. TaxID=47478 RepID=UPI003C7D3F09
MFKKHFVFYYQGEGRLMIIRNVLIFLTASSCYATASCIQNPTSMVNGLFPLPKGLTVDCSVVTLEAARQNISRLGPQEKLIKWHENYHVTDFTNIEKIATCINDQLKSRGYSRRDLQNVGIKDFYIYILSYTDRFNTKVVSVTVFNPAAGSGIQIMGN